MIMTRRRRYFNKEESKKCEFEGYLRIALHLIMEKSFHDHLIKDSFQQ